MYEAASEVLRRTLPSGVFEDIRYGWWVGRAYVRGFGSAFGGHPAPIVHEFPAGAASDLASQIRRVNLLAPTAMCRVMTRHGSDKARRHNYTTVYSALLGELRDKPLRILEVGLGTNNPDLLSSMGAAGKPGASVRGWRDLFPRGEIFGADIDRDILFDDDRIKTFYVDQLDKSAIRDLWSQSCLRQSMDVIVEDGLHTFEANISFLEGSLERLRPGGLYVVEDIQDSAIPQWKELLGNGYPGRFPGFDFALAELPHHLTVDDNNLLIIRRRP